MIKYIYNKIFPFKKYGIRSYSQHGEDLVLKSLLREHFYSPGFFVDVGAHHPYKLSNTALFYQWGWRGINIEPSLDLFKQFENLRPNDINLNLGISSKKQTLEYWMFNQPALNSFDGELSKLRANTTDYKIIDKISVKTIPLVQVFDEYLPINTKIDFMSIDTEGLDLEVLQSNDWSKYSPSFILVEMFQVDFSNLKKNEIYNYLNQIGYELLSFCNITGVFKKKEIN